MYRLLGRIAVGEGVVDAFVLFERALELIDERGLAKLERAQTLQAYAEAQRLLGDEEKTTELMRRADEIYGTLGIEQRRHPWADRFDGGSGADDTIDKEGTPDG